MILSNVSANVSGHFNISYRFEKAGTSGLATLAAQLYKNGVPFGAITINPDENVYMWVNESFSGTINTTDTLAVWGNWSAGNSAFRADDATVTYDYSDGTVIGGAGYNWSANGTFENATFDRGNNHLRYGLFMDSFDDNNADWTYGAGWIVANGVLNQTDNTQAGSIAVPNNTNLTDVDLLFRYKVKSSSSTNSVETVLRYLDSNNFYVTQFEYGSPGIATYLQSKIASVFTTHNTTDYIGSNITQWRYLRFRASGSSLSSKMWNVTDSEPADWKMTATNSTFTYGNIGVGSHRRNIDFDDFWARPINLTQGNYTTEIVDVKAGKKATAYCYYGTNRSGGVQVFVNSSNDNITWSGESTLIQSATNETCGTFSPENSQRYLKLKFNISGNSTDSATVSSFNIQNESQGFVSGYVNYSNGTGVNGATVLYSEQTTATNASGYYEFNIASPMNITIVAGMSGYYPVGTVFINDNGTNNVKNLNFTLLEASVPNPNQLANLAHNLTQDYIPYINSTGHLTNLAYSESKYEGYSEGMLAETIAIGARNTNFTPEYLEAGLRLLNHLSYDVIRKNKFGVEENHTYTGDANYPNHTEFIMWGTTRAMNTLRNNVSSSLWREWNDSMSAFNESSYNRISDTQSNTGYLSTNWLFVLGNSEIERKLICGSCVNETTILNIIQQYNNSVTANGYPQGSELSSNYNTYVYTLARMIQQSYSNTTLNSTILKQRPSVLNASMQDGNIMSYYRSAGHTASYAQNIYNLMMETDNRGEAYLYADLQYQKISLHPDSIGYFPMFQFYSPPGYIGYTTYSRKHLQDTVTGMFLGRAGEVFDNSIAETGRNYYSYHDLVNGEIVSDTLYNSSGVHIINPSNYSAYAMGKFNLGVSAYPYYNGSAIMPLIPIITVKNAQNFTINPMPEVSGGIVGDLRDDSYAFPIMFNNKSVRSSLNFTQSKVYSDVTTNMIKLNISNLNFSTKTIESYNLTISYNATADAMDVTVKLTWDNVTSPLNHFEYGIPFIIDDNRTIATITSGSNNISYERGTESVAITNIELTNGSNLFINTSTQLIGYVPFGKSEITTIEANITQSPVTLKYTHSVNTTNVYGYGFNQPPGVLDYSPDSPVNDIVGANRTFSVSFTQNNVNVTWYLNNTEVQTNNSVSGGTTVYYTNTSSSIGTWVINATGCNAQGCATQLWNWILENTPPSSISNLTNTTTSTSINWTWIDPADADFDKVMVYISGSFITNVSAGVEFYLNSSFSPNTEYTISTRTVDTAGNINQTWVNQTSQTASQTSTTTSAASSGDSSSTEDSGVVAIHPGNTTITSTWYTKFRAEGWDYTILMEGRDKQPVQAINLYFNTPAYGEYMLMLTTYSVYTPSLQDATSYFSITTERPLDIKNTSSMEIKSNEQIAVYQLQGTEWVLLRREEISSGMYRISISSFGTFAIRSKPFRASQEVEDSQPAQDYLEPINALLEPVGDMFPPVKGHETEATTVAITGIALVWLGLRRYWRKPKMKVWVWRKWR